MMVLECPEALIAQTSHDISIFLGGGITGCPDWQQEAINQFGSYSLDDLILLNPRRSTFDITDPTMSEFQIKWEAHHLKHADAIIFWFPCETLCPITLFELGKHAQKGDRIFVGCHPDYARAFDVKHQLSLIPSQAHVKVHDNLYSLITDAALYVSDQTHFKL